MIKFNDYKKCLLNDEVILKSQQRFISKKHDVYIENINKIALSNNDDKRIISSNKEEGVIKLLKDIRDSLAGNVIIPARPPRPNDDGYYNGNDDGNDNGNYNGDDNGNDNGNDDGDDLSWINDLQLYKKIASEVFCRYNGDKDSFEFFTLRTFIGNINNERVKNKKDA